MTVSSLSSDNVNWLCSIMHFHIEISLDLPLIAQKRVWFRSFALILLRHIKTQLLEAIFLLTFGRILFDRSTLIKYGIEDGAFWLYAESFDALLLLLLPDWNRLSKRCTNTPNIAQRVHLIVYNCFNIVRIFVFLLLLNWSFPMIALAVHFLAWSTVISDRLVHA